MCAVRGGWCALLVFDREAELALPADTAVGTELADTHDVRQLDGHRDGGCMVVVVQFLFLHSQSPESAATNSRDCWADHAGRAYHVVIRKGLKVFRHFVDLGQALRAVGIQDLREGE